MVSRTKSIQKIFSGTFVIFLVILMAGGCAKKLTPPEIEAADPDAPALEQELAQEGISESVFEEKGFQIDEQERGKSGEFITEGPEGAPAEEPKVAEEFGQGAAPDFDASGSRSDFSSDTGPMAMQNGAFEASPFEAPAEPPAPEPETPPMVEPGHDQAGATQWPVETTPEPENMTPPETEVPSSFESFANESTPEPAPDPVAEEARLLSFKTEGQLEDIHFDFDQYDLDDRSKQVLQRNGEWLRNNPTAKVEIQGHCDERGTNNYNLGLGERRALATKNYLVALGIEADRLFTISYGEEKPFCFQSNDQCWHDNRRAHFMVAE